MELSAHLIVGIVLLVVVLGLTVWQRSQQVDRTAGGRMPGGSVAAAPARPGPADAGEAEPRFVFSRDDLLGVIVWDDGIWIADDEQAFAGTTVSVEVHGHRSGLTESQNEFVRLALKYPRDLDGRAREVIAQELRRQNLEDATTTPYELSVRAGDDGRDIGILWYEIEGTGRDIGVSSVDGWKTLTVRTERERDEDGLDDEA